MEEKEYFAFISYKREDEKWAAWLQHKLEHYKLPSNLNGRTDLPKYIRPVFKDTSDLSSGVLSTEIKAALEKSKYLIIICSPNASRSKWVNKEAQEFIDSGRSDRIIPFIIEGIPYSGEPESECFPRAIRELPESKELLGINIKEMGRDAALVKVVSHMLGLSFDTLWQRHEKENRRIRAFWIIGALIVALAGFLAGFYFYRQNNKLKINQSKFIAEKAQSLTRENSILARRLAVYALPSNLKHPDRPYVSEAESALRTAFRYNTVSYQESNKGNYITCVAFSPDGDYVIYGSEDGSVKKWDTKNGGNVTNDIGNHRSRVNAIAFSPDGQSIASCSSDGDVLISALPPSSPSSVVIGSKNDSVNASVNDVAFSPDGRQIVCCSSDGSIDILDVESHNLLVKLTGHDAAVSCIGISEDGRTLVSGSFDKTLIVWDLQNKEPVCTLRGHEDRVLAVSISRDGKLIASASSDKKVKIWDMESGKELRMLEGHLNEVTSVEFSPDVTRIVTGSNDGQIKIWETSEGKELRTLSQDYHRVTSVAFSPDGNSIVSGSTSCSVKTWEIETTAEQRIFDAHSFFITSVAFSPDGKYVASGSADRTVKIWDAEKCSPIRTLATLPRPVKAIAYSPDGCFVAVGSDDGKLSVFETQTGKMPFNAISAHNDWITGVSFDPEGRRIVTGSYDKTINVWDSFTGKLVLGPIVAHDDWITDVEFSRDGKLIASSSYDRTVKLWNASQGNIIRAFSDTVVVMGMAFSPNGRDLACCSDGMTIKIWDIKKREETPILCFPKSHNSTISSISYNVSGDRLVSASNDNLIKVWNTKTGKEIQSFDGHGDWVLSVSFSPDKDSRRIVSGSADNSIRIWHFLPLQELIDTTRANLKGADLLSKDERTKYNID